MTETLTLSSNGVTPGDLVQLHMCLAGGMQGAPGAHISSIIPFQGVAYSPNLSMIRQILKPVVKSAEITASKLAWLRLLSAQMYSFHSSNPF